MACPWFLILAALLPLSVLAAESDYPSKPIRIIVQFTPGTSTDIMARLIAQKMSEHYGKPVIVDNRPGAGAVIGTESGSTSHLTMEMFRSAAGIQVNHIPFKGSGEAHAQVIGGQVPVMFDAIPATLPHIKSGKVRGLGIATLTRSPFAPDLPTIAEAGYPGFEAVGWIGIAAPAKTPPAVIDKLNAEMKRILAEPDVKDRLATLAFTPVGDSPAQFAAYIKSEIAKWGKAAKDSGAKAD